MQPVIQVHIAAQIFALLLFSKWNYWKNPGVSNGKFGSSSTGSIEKSRPMIGELVAEVLAEIISVRSDSEFRKLWTKPKLLIWHGGVEK